MYFSDVGVRQRWGVLVDKKLRYEEGHSSLFVTAGSLCLMSQLPKSCIWCWPFTVHAGALILDSLQKHFGQKVACISQGSRYSQIPLSCSIVMFKAALFAVFFHPSMASAGWPHCQTNPFCLSHCSQNLLYGYQVLLFSCYCVWYCIIGAVRLFFPISVLEMWPPA